MLRRDDQRWRNVSFFDGSGLAKALRIASRQAVAAFVVAVTLSACVTLPREPTPVVQAEQAGLPGFPDVRFTFDDPALSREALETDLRGRLTRDGAFDMLALSGGGAEGAFGAGVLVGLTRAEARREYDIVTGVSTGALLAPFAFLGPEWDPKLVDAFTGGHTEGLLASRGFAALFGTSIYRGDPLRVLVERYVSGDLLSAVAAAHAEGRRLLVVTTNLDTQQAVVWDMGAIASKRTEAARRLFTDVLVASASVPVVFPPVMIAVDGDGRRYEEMHVDGGAIASFFAVPERLLLWTDRSGALRKSRIFVIVNGKLGFSPETTPRNTLAIAARSFDTVLRTSARRDILAAASFAERNDIGFHFTAIPDDVESDGTLGFDTVSMRRLFDHGVALGASGTVWEARVLPD